MSWIDRLRESAYTSPSGLRQVFLYEDVNEEFTKKGAAFDFAGADGTFIQDLGVTGRRYPLLVIFSGTDYDQEAATFMDSIAERGAGSLEHPIYGLKKVVPFGRIRRRDDLKTAANQAIIQLTFFVTLGTIFPTSQSSPAAETLEALEEFKQKSAEAFEELLELDSAVETSTFKSQYQQILDVVSNALQPIADAAAKVQGKIAGITEQFAAAQATVSERFNAIKDSINNSIDVLVGQPLTLAFQTIALIKVPGAAFLSITDRLGSYRNLLGNIIDSGIAFLAPGSDSRVANSFHTRDLFAMSMVTAAVNAVIVTPVSAASSTGSSQPGSGSAEGVNNQFSTKVEALAAAEVLLVMLDEVTVWREDNYESLDEIDTGEAYQQMLNSVALAAGFLVDISFSLKQERSVTLTRARTIIDLEAELYGTVDTNLDFLINTNDLTGDEILELPRGREIVYYV